jgi:hypothetical protein
MGPLIEVLAFVGVAALIGAGIQWYQREPAESESPPEVDLAAPYREGLHAAIRLQNAGRDMEQQIYAEAIRQAESDSGQP